MSDGKAKKILIVDDDRIIIKTIEYKLTSAGYGVITAFNGEEGLRKAKAEKPDMIVLDLLMPKMDGAQMEKMLRLDEETREIPVVFLTRAIDKKEAAVMDNRLANFLILAKPFDGEELLSVIRKALKE